MTARVKPLALTCGEPASIAPEITARAWQHFRTTSDSFLLIGDGAHYARLARQAGLELPVQEISTPMEAPALFPRALPVMHMNLKEAPIAGQLSLPNESVVTQAIERAVVLCMVGEAAGMVTNPIQKEAFYATGFKFQGHTDYLAHLSRARGADATDVMMLVAGDLRAIPVTVHIPLADVPKALTQDAIFEQAKVAAAAMQKYFGIASPRIAMTGLNPHAGENGTLGGEEKAIVIPAIERLRAAGMDVTGPWPADTAFHAAARQAYDVILCMYHDQALIPAKTIDFHGGVNVTLGLPFIRTSPDHGTALNLAGKGQANPASLIAALTLARKMADAARQ